MKCVTMSDEEESANLCIGLTLDERDIDLLDRIRGRLLDKIAKLERSVPPPEERRMNMLEHSLDVVWKAQIKAIGILEDAEARRKTLSQRLDYILNARVRMYTIMDDLRDRVERIEDRSARAEEAAIKQSKRLTDIEEFLGDL